MSIDYDRAALIYTEIAKGRTEGQSFSVRFGGLTRGKWYLVQYAGGLSWVSGTKYSYDANYSKHRENFSTLGLTGKLGVLLSPNIVGLGLGLIFHINNEFTYSGITLNLAIGQINGRKGK